MPGFDTRSSDEPSQFNSIDLKDCPLAALGLNRKRNHEYISRQGREVLLENPSTVPPSNISVLSHKDLESYVVMRGKISGGELSPVTLSLQSKRVKTVFEGVIGFLSSSFQGEKEDFSSIVELKRGDELQALVNTNEKAVEEDTGYKNFVGKRFQNRMTSINTPEKLEQLTQDLKECKGKISGKKIKCDSEVKRLTGMLEEQKKGWGMRGNEYLKKERICKSRIRSNQASIQEYQSQFSNLEKKLKTLNPSKFLWALKGAGDAPSAMDSRLTQEQAEVRTPLKTADDLQSVLAIREQKPEEDTGYNGFIGKSFERKFSSIETHEQAEQLMKGLIDCKDKIGSRIYKYKSRIALFTGKLQELERSGGLKVGGYLKKECMYKSKIKSSQKMVEEFDFQHSSIDKNLRILVYEKFSTIKVGDIPQNYQDILERLDRVRKLDVPGMGLGEEKTSILKFQQASIQKNYPYIHEMIRGLGAIELRMNEIVRADNKKSGGENPAISLMKQVSGLNTVMHPDQNSVEASLKGVSESMNYIINSVKEDKQQMIRFFYEAFDSVRDACLEAKCTKILEFGGRLRPSKEQVDQALIADVPADGDPFKTVSAHAYVFKERCLRQLNESLGGESGKDYYLGDIWASKRVELENDGFNEKNDFESIYNADSFKEDARNGNYLRGRALDNLDTCVDDMVALTIF